MSTPPRRTAPSHVSPRPSPGTRARTRRQIGPFAVTPFRVLLALAFLSGPAYIGWAILRVRDSSQIPMVTTGFAVLGLAFAALSVGSAIRMWQVWQEGRQGQTLLLAALGGISGMLALGSFAGTLVLSLVWGG